jgi:hypothetical protein
MCMPESPLDYEMAMEWLSSHPFRDLLKHKQQALKLGPRCFPGMIEVLAHGPTDLHGQAAIVMSLNGATVTPRGSTVADYEYLVSLPGGVTQAVKPIHVTEDDLDFGP